MTPSFLALFRARFETSATASIRALASFWLLLRWILPKLGKRVVIAAETCGDYVAN
ncbi:MAG: hypothetical protein QXZ70_01265 [Candidatus Bathyarchaeia archaeon]